MKCEINMNQSKKNTIITLIFLLIFITGTILIFTVPVTVKSTYGLTTQTEDGVTISFNVFEPQEEYYKAANGDAKKKAILIGHGNRANKEMLKGYAIELAAAGFVAVAFDFRGHGQSLGVLTREGLVKDVRAIRDYLSSRDDIDQKNLGYIGYSMGGSPGWAIIKEDLSFKCFIGIGTGLPSPTYYPDYVVKIGSGRKFNVLMIQARYDEAVTVERLKEGMALRLGVNTGDIDVNKLYGSFQSGTASMIHLDDNTNHLLLCWDQDFIRAARNWVISTFPSVRQPDENFYVNIRGIILLVQLVGGMGLFFAIVEPLSNLILKRKKEEDKDEDKGEDIFKIELPEVSITNLSMRALIYLLVLGLVGIIIFMPLTYILPLYTIATVIMLLFGQMLALLILTFQLGKKANLSLKENLLGPFRQRNNLLREFLLGVILAMILYLIVYISIGLNYFAILPSLNKIIFVPMYLVIEFFILLVFSVFANATLQNKYGDGMKEQFKAGLVIFGLQVIYMTFYLFLLSVLQGSLFTFGVFMPVVIPVTLLGSFVSVIAYKKREI